MRSVPVSTKSKLLSHVQAGDKELSVSLWVARPTTQLTDDGFLERQRISTLRGVSKTSVAVCHPFLSRDATEIYIGYIQDGKAKATVTSYQQEMSRHKWEVLDFEENATDIAVCFDGTMPKSNSDEVEFKTEEVPWIFWVDGGKLYGQHLNGNDRVLLVESNCTAISAVRSMWSSYGSFDFGLVVFFIANGILYYRQLIGGEWYDAEIVSYGVEKSWVDVAAFRTWDYRVGVQLRASDDSVYELITQFMGVGKQTSEHIEMNARFSSDFIELDQHYTSENEHIDMQLRDNTLYGGLYSTLQPNFVSAENIEDEDGDFGKIIRCKVDVHLVAADVASAFSSFALVDSWNISYYPVAAELQSDGLTVVLRFFNFNNARGVCKLRYERSVVHTMAGTLVDNCEIGFVPVNLVPSEVPVPEVHSLWNE